MVDLAGIFVNALLNTGTLVLVALPFGIIGGIALYLYEQAAEARNENKNENEKTLGGPDI